MMFLAWRRLVNQCVFRHSSRSLPLKLSTCPFCIGFPVQISEITPLLKRQKTTWSACRCRDFPDGEVPQLWLRSIPVANKHAGLLELFKDAQEGTLTGSTFSASFRP